MSDPEEGVPQHIDAPREPGVAAVAQQAAAPPQLAEPIWARIRRHKVVEWTLAYVAFAYALLNGVQMLREAFDWPAGALDRGAAVREHERGQGAGVLQ